MADEAGKTDLEQAVDGFLGTIKAASDALQKVTRPPAAPPTTEPLSEQRLAKVAEEQGTAAAISAFAREGVMPVVMDTNTKMSNVRKEMAQRDANTGPL